MLSSVFNVHCYFGIPVSVLHHLRTSQYLQCPPLFQYSSVRAALPSYSLASVCDAISVSQYLTKLPSYLSIFSVGRYLTMSLSVQHYPCINLYLQYSNIFFLQNLLCVQRCIVKPLYKGFPSSNSVLLTKPCLICPNKFFNFL